MTTKGIEPHIKIPGCLAEWQTTIHSILSLSQTSRDNHRVSSELNSKGDSSLKPVIKQLERIKVKYAPKHNKHNWRYSTVRTKILTNDAYKEDPEFVKCIFEGIVSNRIDEENKQKEQTLREFELQKIRLQNETQRVVGPQTLPQTKIELEKLLPTFNPKVDNIGLFLSLFERQMKLLDLGEDLWVPYLIGALPSDVTSLIAREPEEKCRITPTFEECFCNGSN
ncbi:uncharacterized protein TNCV_2760381 [Trichonephila clavipes]|nr:uncharacterized protein TNCV_2760381 [Trichonephila clavipes]